jgi:hypothetical protein
MGFVMSAYLWRHGDRSAAPSQTAPIPPQVATSSSSTPAVRLAPCGDLDQLVEQARQRARANAPTEDSPLESRARLTEEIAALLGRQSGETDTEYRARLAGLMQLALAIPRARAIEMRQTAEAKAHVTREQSKQLDDALTKSYADMLASTNKAIADGTLSPYERNVAGWLQFGGEIGGELNAANQSIGKILDAAQVRAMYDAGFEWSEYIGLTAPWENFAVVPPNK